MVEDGRVEIRKSNFSEERKVSLCREPRPAFVEGGESGQLEGRQTTDIHARGHHALAEVHFKDLACLGVKEVTWVLLQAFHQFQSSKAFEMNFSRGLVPEKVIDRL